MALQAQAWVDFNDVHNGRTTTLRRYVEDGVLVYVGASLTVGDYDGNLCQSTVTGIDGDIIDLALDPQRRPGRVGQASASPR